MALDEFTLGMIVAAGIASDNSTVTAFEILGAAGIKHGSQLKGADAHDIEIFVKTGMAMDGLGEALAEARKAQGESQ